MDKPRKMECAKTETQEISYNGDMEKERVRRSKRESKCLRGSKKMEG